MFKTAIFTSVASASAAPFVCQNPQVTWCYKAPEKACLDVFTQMDKLTKQAMDVLPNKSIRTKTVYELLQAGKEFKETWTVEQPGDGFVYISVLKF